MNYKYTWVIYPVNDRYADKDQEPEWFKNPEKAIRSAEFEWEYQFTNTDRERYEIAVLAVSPATDYDPEDDEYSDPWDMRFCTFGADKVIKSFKS